MSKVRESWRGAHIHTHTLTHTHTTPDACTCTCQPAHTHDQRVLTLPPPCLTSCAARSIAARVAGAARPRVPNTASSAPCLCWMICDECFTNKTGTRERVKVDCAVIRNKLLVKHLTQNTHTRTHFLSFPLSLSLSLFRGHTHSPHTHTLSWSHKHALCRGRTLSTSSGSLSASRKQSQYSELGRPNPANTRSPLSVRST